MKIVTIIALFILSVFSAKAQHIIQFADMPALGDSIQVWLVDTTGVVEGPSGFNLTWDFANIIPGDSSTSHFVDVSTTIKAALFPNSDFASDNGSSQHAYYTSTPTELIIDGFADSASGITYVYSNPQIVFTLPWDINSTLTDSFFADYMFDTIPAKRWGLSVTTSDGYGDLILPQGTFPNALRIKFVQTIVDTFYFSFPIPAAGSFFTSTSYAWYVDGTKESVFSIIYFTFNFGGPSSSSKVVQYSKTAMPTVGISDKKVQQGSMKLYPNPVDEELQIVWYLQKASPVQIGVFDLTGRKVLATNYTSMKAGHHLQTLNVRDLPQGVYLVRLETENSTETKRITVR